MKNAEMSERRKKKPIKLVIQELTIKSDLLLGFERVDGSFFINETTMIAREFSEKIHTVYSSYSAQEKKSPERGDRRWTHLEKCLGGNMQIEKQEDFAPKLKIHKNMIGDAHLLHDEHRAGIDAVCLVLLGLGCFPWESCNRKDAAAEEALCRMTDEENRDLCMQKLRAQRAKARRKLGEELRGYFAGSVPLEERIMEAARKKEEQMTRQEAETAAGQAVRDIRRIAGPFGYWLPDSGDDERRRACILEAKAAAKRLAGKTKATVKKPQDRNEENLKISRQMCEYLRMTRQVVSTLYDPEDAWSDNPNRLRMIIVSCDKEDGAKEIERVYHAFGLHPAGLCDGKDGMPYFPADQVVMASIKTFRPMTDSMMRRRGYSFGEKMSVFWGLLFIKLNHCDRVAYAGTDLKLRDALFSFRSLNEDVVDDLIRYWQMRTAGRGTGYGYRQRT